MKKKPVWPWWFFCGVLAFLAVINLRLPGAWRTDPANEFGFPAFLLWAAGLFLLARHGGPVPRSGLCWVGALLLGLAGQLGDLEVLKQAALGVLAASTVRPVPSQVLATVAALAWTPAWGWTFRHLLGSDFDFYRLAFVIACLAGAWLIRSSSRLIHESA